MRGLWLPFVVSKDDIVELQGHGYLPPPAKAKARSPLVKGPTGYSSVRVLEPRAGERIIFISHLLRGLGFPIHPFLRCLLHFYGLQLHHLAPNSILHIACYITFCEAFLCTEPHFGLWLKLFYVKMQTNDGRPTECGAAMISKITNAKWMPEKFIETVKHWQEEWFYMYHRTDGIPTAFSAAPLDKLNSWNPKRLTWGTKQELTTLLERVEFFIGKGVNLVDVVHVMLYRGVQPLQARAHPLWKFTEENDETSVIGGFLRKRDLAGMQALLFTSKDQPFRLKGPDVAYWADRRPTMV